MKTKTRFSKLTAWLLTLVMLMTFIPSFTLGVSAADETTTEKNITLGTTALEGGQASYIYFGTYQQSSLGNTQPTEGTEGVDWIKSTTAVNNEQGAYYSKDPIKWRVLSNDGSKLFLLSDQNLDVFEYNKEYEAVTYETSTIRSWLNGYGATSNQNGVDYSSDNFINAAFGAAEKGVIADTNVVNATYDGTSGTNPNPSYSTSGGNDTTDKVFLLSIAEAQNTAYGFTNNENSTDKRKATNTAYVAGGGKIGGSRMYGVGESDYWWLRSPGFFKDYAVYVRYDGRVGVYGTYVSGNRSAVRPAFNLNLSSVLFKSAAVGGKPTGFNAVEEYTGNEYKLTLLDSTRNFALTDTSAKTAHSGDVLSLTYTGATTGTNEYISAMIVGESGEVIYYGQLAQAASASGTVSLTVPADIEFGNYTLKLFNEQINGDYKTDYSSAFVDISLTVGHNYNNGICTVCGEYQPADLSNGIYEIGNAGQLMWFSEFVNSGNLGANAVLVDNIDMNGISWTPIGTETPYTGTFNGGGYAINNLWQNTGGRDGGRDGLIVTLGSGGKVHDLTVDSALVWGESRYGANGTGVIAIRNAGTISNCVIKNSSVQQGAYEYLGGIAGVNDAGGIIENCAVIGTAFTRRWGGSSSGTMGGIVQTNNGTVKNCYTYGCSFDNGRSEKAAVVSLGNAPENCYYYTASTVAATYAEAKTAEAFASGEVTYLLNSGVTDGTQAWYQTLGEDDYPKFSGKTVYYDETETVYYNEKVKVTVDGESVETYGYIVLGTDNGDGTYSLPDNVVGYYLDDDFVDAGKYAVVGGEVINTVDFNVTMVNGAQVRYGGGLDENGKVNEGNGLRFLATVDRSNFDGIGYGMKITAEGSSEETIVNAEKWQSDDVIFTVAITDMAVSNYNRNFTATPFVKVKYADGTTKTIYGTETVTRSIYYVAAGLLKMGNNGNGIEDNYGAGVSYGLYDVLNAYVNMVGVRLNLYADGTVTANTDRAGSYTGDVFFDVASVDNGNGSYTITVTPVTQDFAYPVEIMSYWNEFVRINNNNSVVKNCISESIIENGVLTFKFTLPSGN